MGLFNLSKTQKFLAGSLLVVTVLVVTLILIMKFLVPDSHCKDCKPSPPPEWWKTILDWTDSDKRSWITV